MEGAGALQTLLLAGGRPAWPPVLLNLRSSSGRWTRQRLPPEIEVRLPVSRGLVPVVSQAPRFFPEGGGQAVFGAHECRG